MKAALYGVRKILLFVAAVSAVVVLSIVSLDALKVITDAKATQAASIAVAALGAISTIFATLMSAFKGGYERDATIEAAKAASGQSPTVVTPTPPPGT